MTKVWTGEQAATNADAEQLSENCRHQMPLANCTRCMRAEIVRLRGLKPELPPREPDGEGLPRYGIRWNGPSDPLAVPMEDGYWTPWHLAEANLKIAHEQADHLAEAALDMGDAVAGLSK